MSQPAHYSGYAVSDHDAGGREGSLPVADATPHTVMMLHVAPPLTKRARQTLWLDAVAGAVAGSVLLTWREWLAAQFDFPVELVALNAIANLSYASYSGTLATLTAVGIAPPRGALTTLVVANAGWMVVCFNILARVWAFGSGFGLGYVALEGLFVGALAVVEYRVFFRRTSAIG